MADAVIASKYESPSLQQEEEVNCYTHTHIDSFCTETIGCVAASSGWFLSSIRADRAAQLTWRSLRAGSVHLRRSKTFSCQGESVITETFSFRYCTYVCGSTCGFSVRWNAGYNNENTCERYLNNIHPSIRATVVLERQGVPSDLRATLACWSNPRIPTEAAVPPPAPLHHPHFKV